jgi:hypothetical protein
MTRYGSEYDGSDHGQWDGTNEACSFCDDSDCVEYNGDWMCLSCLENMFYNEIEEIAEGYLSEKNGCVEAIENAMGWMQVELIESPKHCDFIGFKLVFQDDERETLVRELESYKNKEYK